MSQSRPRGPGRRPVKAAYHTPVTSTAQGVRLSRAVAAGDSCVSVREIADEICCGSLHLQMLERTRHVAPRSQSAEHPQDGCIGDWSGNP